MVGSAGLTLTEATQRAKEWLAGRGRSEAKLLHGRMLPWKGRALLHWSDPLARWEAVLVVGDRVNVLYEGEYWVPPREFTLRRMRLEVVQCECGERFELTCEDLPLEEESPQ